MEVRKMSLKYKWLLFDADDTLLDFKLGEKRAITATFESVGLPTDDEVIETYSRINDNLWKMLERGEVTKDRLKVLRFEQFCEHYGFDFDGAMLADAYLVNLNKQTVLLEGAEDVCRALYGKYKMYIITNGIEAVQKSRIGGSAIREYFEKCFISDAIGVAKPKKGFFDAVSADIPDFDKSQALIIGDSLTSDIKGGVEYGIDTCWLNPSGKEAPVGMDITYTIGDIRELLEILE